MQQLEARPAPAVPPAEVPDAALAERIRGGDLAALEALMRRYNQRLYRVARSVLRDDALAEDAVQEAWIAAYRGLGRYAEGGRLAAWLARIAFNEALMIRRGQQRHESRRSPENVESVSGEDVGAAGPLDPAEATANAELTRYLEAAVDRLPDHFRTVFVLRAIEQMSVEETAAALDLAPATVKTRFHRARGLMRDSVTRQMGQSELDAFGFAGARCDRIVAAVMRRLGVPSPGGPRRPAPGW